MSNQYSDEPQEVIDWIQEAYNYPLGADGIKAIWNLCESRDETIQSLQETLKKAEIARDECKVNYLDLKGTVQGKICGMCNYLERSACYENTEKLEAEIQSLQAENERAKKILSDCVKSWGDYSPTSSYAKSSLVSAKDFLKDK